MVTTYQRYIELLREAQASQDDVDNYDLRSEDRASINEFEDRKKAAATASLALICFITTLSGQIIKSIFENLDEPEEEAASK